MPSGHCKLDTETNKPIQNSGSKRFSGDFGGGGGCKEQGGGGKGDLPRPTSDTPRNESFKFLFFSKTKDPPQKLGTAHHRQSSAGLAEEFDFG